MTGNSKRRGAVRKPGSKKGPRVGSGGRGKRALEGRGPTPRAEDRPGHPAARARTREKRPGRPPAVGNRIRESVAGRNPVLEALRAGVPADGLRVVGGIEPDDRLREILALAVASRLDVREASKSDIDALTGGVVHQGVALLVRPFSYSDLDDLVGSDGVPLVVALDGIQDPRNLGAILRSAQAFGASGVVIPERRAASVTAAAWKSSAGAASRIAVARVANLPRAIRALKERGLFVVGLDTEGESPLRESPLLGEPLVLAVGSEGRGLSRLVREACDQVVSIPMSADTESLNASVAASLALYEARAARG